MNRDDVDAFNFIKEMFWEKNATEVEIPIRRKTLEGDSVWVISKIASFVDIPVPGMIIQENLAKDTERAEYMNKVIRMSIVILNTIEACQKMSRNAHLSNNTGNENIQNYGSALQAILSDKAASTDVKTDDVTQMRELLQIDSNQVTSNKKDTSVTSQQESDAFNDFEILPTKNSPGIGLNLSKFNMDYSDVKLLTLIVTGHFRIENFASFVLKALLTNGNLEQALKSYKTELDWQRENKKYLNRINSKSDKSRSSHRRLESRPLLTSASNHHFQRKSLNYTSYSQHQQNQQSRSKKHINQSRESPPSPRKALTAPPPLTFLNLSYTNLANQGLETLCEVLTSNSKHLRILDIGFCSIDEKGFLSFSRALRQRKKERLPNLNGLILSGNKISYKAAKELGLALSPTSERKNIFRKQPRLRNGGGNGYVEDDEEDDDDDETFFGENNNSSKIQKAKEEKMKDNPSINPEDGLIFLHLTCTSLTPDSLFEFLVGLGQFCPVQELVIASNNIGPEGATRLAAFLEGKGIRKYNKGKPVMARLDRIDISNNNLGNDGAAKLTRAILKRVNVKLNIVKMKLSSNNISAQGIETIMDKLLRHNLMSLSLDNNMISDRGCQLVAASLPSMHHISRLNLNFNQIGSRGITALMRAIVSCESIKSLCVSGNVLKVSGAIAMGFALAQHPRLAQLELENCCLSQVSQCHIVAGITSNRWVPMKEIIGFRVGPPMAAIGGLDPIAHHLSNEECFRIRRDIQRKNILQWMETARAIQLKQNEGATEQFSVPSRDQSLYESGDVSSQSAYIRMLEWLSRIPFDEEELNDLRRYFFDVDGSDSGDGMRGSDGLIDLKQRGDLLAALGSKIVEEIRDSEPFIVMSSNSSDIGLSLDELEKEKNNFIGEVWKGFDRCKSLQAYPSTRELESYDGHYETCNKKRRKDEGKLPLEKSSNEKELDVQTKPSSSGLKGPPTKIQTRSLSCSSRNSSLTSAKSGLSCAESVASSSAGSRSKKKARITLFPPFAQKLDLLKSQAQQMMDMERDQYQQDAIAQKFAEDSLTLLRQLRYHCMNNGLDGWRQGKLRRKVLIVDDSIVTRKLVSRAFEKANFIVDTAANGREGVEKLKLAIYDIAFMDIDMPIMNGFDATKALREWEDENRPGARQPICALTAAYVDDFERTELMKFKNAGVDVMESKPCNIPRLFKVVDDVSPMFSDLSINVTKVTT